MNRANKKSRFVAFVFVGLAKHAEAIFFDNFDDLAVLIQPLQMPRSQDLAIFAPTTQDDDNRQTN